MLGRILNANDFDGKVGFERAFLEGNQVSSIARSTFWINHDRRKILPFLKELPTGYQCGVYLIFIKPTGSIDEDRLKGCREHSNNWVFGNLDLREEGWLR